MPSGKRETERKGNAPVNTDPSPNSDGRVNNPGEEADEPARAIACELRRELLVATTKSPICEMCESFMPN
ncbi:hypothetical protein T4D_6453 [Trichinella pseudospiralis]|uniref:Uncharacterized protein n=1 Tax=Trichinella pseudospiralis TaxID=6337 RepID=A0A0V1G4B9_TRIPS|nr:hypothetical protein T4D_6453 [Trichinella pseudospiralis]